MGTPVVGTNIGGVPEIIEDGVTGVLVRNIDFQNLSRSVSELYGNRELLRQMSYRCLERHYITDTEYAEKMVNIYKKLQIKQK